MEATEAATHVESATDKVANQGSDQAPSHAHTNKPQEPVTLAIVGQDEAQDTFIIWHIELAPQLKGDRLSGAWLVEAAADHTPDHLYRLVADCSVYVLPGAEVGVVKRAIAEAAVPEVDLDASVEAIRRHIGELKQQVKEEKDKPGRAKLAEPRFPRIDDFEPIPFAHVGEAVAGDVLAVARGVEKLIAQWGELEGVRCRRKYLREPWGKEARQLPLAAKSSRL